MPTEPSCFGMVATCQAYCSLVINFAGGGDQRIKLVCCVTPDIDDYILKAISQVYDHVIPVEYIKLGKNRTGRQTQLPFMFTRFRFLQLTQFDKVLIFDADMLPLSGYDKLFELNAPAGVINESKDHMKGMSQTKKKLEKWEWHDMYEPHYGHGKLLPKEITDRPLQQPEANMGINGGLMLLRPSTTDSSSFTTLCQNPANVAVIARMPWPDMQAITAFYSGQWINIDAKYLGLYGYPNIASLNGIHFIGPKPWQWRAQGFAYRLNTFPDYRLWADEYLHMCEERPELLKYKQLDELKRQIELTATKL